MSKLCLRCGSEYQDHSTYGLCLNCRHCKECGQFISLGRHVHNKMNYVCNDCDWSTQSLVGDIPLAFKGPESTWCERCDSLLARAKNGQEVLDIYHAFGRACELADYVSIDMKTADFEKALREKST